MARKPTKFILCILGGILVVAFYCAFTFTSVALFPTPLSPATHWLSDLGNSTYSPAGAIWYNVGCMLTGASICAFFLGFATWYSPQKWKTALVVAAQALGIVDGIALFMIGVYSEDFISLHVLWSSIFFATNLLVLIITNAALLSHTQFYKGVALYGFAVAAINLIFVWVASHSPLLEWVTVFTALGFVVLLVTNTFRKFGK